MPNLIIYVIDDDDAARDGLVFLLTSSNLVVQVPGMSGIDSSSRDQGS